MDDQLYQPTILHPAQKEDKAALIELFNLPGITICDTIESQLLELLEIRSPGKRFKPEDLREHYSDLYQADHLNDYGCWVYYPWKHTVVHCLPEEAFTEVRTSRNKYKISDREEELLRKKRIGVVGLSVGQAIAVTIAQERSVGTLRLADFDRLELSNMNRIRTGIHSIGLPKVLIAAREIAEIDPFIDIEIYPEGINEGNIDAFLSEQGKLDILIDECDSLDIKVLLRERAKQLQVPVIMETNDRCMVDIERFDQEHDRSIFHGVLGGDFDSSHLSQLTTREKIPFALKILGINQLSLRMKASLLEIENSINGWPQLASDVNMGGGVLANICRKILLGENVKSGRYYVDLDELFSIEEIADRAETALRSNSDEQTKRHPGKSDNGIPKRSIDDVLIKKIIRESLNAPSGGNLQPWEFVPHDKGVFIGINKSRISSELDPLLFGANVAIGAVAENIALTAKNYNLEAITTFSHQSANGNEFAAKIDFQKPEGDFQPSEQDKLLFNMISKRKTNRALNQQPVDKDKLLQINTFLSAEHEEQFLYVFDQEKIEAIAKLIGIADRLRMSYQNFHKELMQEICWSESEALKRRNGIYIKDLGISEDNAAINIMRDWEIMHFLKQIDKGQGTEKLSREVFQKENALGLFVTNHNSPSSFLQAGRALQKAWLYSTSLNLDWHPATSSIYFFLQLDFPEKIKLPTELVDQLKTMRAEFNELFQLNGSEGLVMLTRFVNSADSKATSLRMPLEKVYTEAYT